MADLNCKPFSRGWPVADPTITQIVEGVANRLDSLAEHLAAGVVVESRDLFDACVGLFGRATQVVRRARRADSLQELYELDGCRERVRALAASVATLSEELSGRGEVARG